jgi:hypothetical protein
MIGSVTNSTITDNVAGTGGDAGNANGGDGGNSVNGTGGDGGGGFAQSTGRGAQGGFGGGVSLSVPYGDLTVRHATVTGNSAGAGGDPGTPTAGSGGTGGAASGSPGTVTDGALGSPGRGGGLGSLFPNTTLVNSIVASNPGKNCDGPLVDGGHNIAYPGTSCSGAAHVAPKLAALANNGGPTRTRALGPGSPAINAVPASGAGCTAHDQRGVVRPNGTACDSGAYEHAPPTVVIDAATGITRTAATLHGRVNPNARPTTYRFVYGKTTSYGNSTTARKLKAGTKTVAIAASLRGLTRATTYHYRLIATNADGTARGGDRTFRTNP